VIDLAALALLTPADGEFFELQNSTGAESDPLITGVPVGLAGDPDLSFRLRYDDPPGEYVFIEYFSTDPESRYIRIGVGAIVNADINASAAIVDTKLATISSSGKVSNTATTAASANTANAIVARDASGNFSAGTITAALTGAASANVLKAGDTMTGVLAITAGTAALPAITPSGDPNTGIFSPGADQVAISTNGTKRLEIQADGDIQLGGSSGVFFDATNNRLAIGTTSPGQVLDVVGDAQIGPTSGSGTLLLGVRGFSASLRYNGITGDLDIAPRGGFGIAFKSDIGGTTERARIDSSGRLLVGTSTSMTVSNGQFAKLQMVGNSFSANNDAIIAIGRGEAATAITDGEGLGKIAFTDNAGGVFCEINGVADGTAAANDYPGRLVFSTTASGASSPTERMRINSSGALKQQGAGSSLENSAGDYSEFNNNAIGTTALLQRCTSGSFTGAVSVLKSVKAANTDFQFITAEANAVIRFNVRGDGNVTNTNNSYGAISDIKLKENIVDANSQWDDLKALQVRNYNFKEGQTHTQIGLVAQEAELVSPGLVSESPDRDEEDNDLGTTTKSVNYSVLYMKAVKALQEAMERIEILEQRLNDAGIA
jgi:hypothetical protein